MMKTKRSTFKQFVKTTFILLAIFGIQSCETDIPPVDTSSPTFSFEISGDGFSQTFDQDTDFDSFQLNLRDGATYSYTLTGIDDGGVERIQWFISGSDYVTILDPIERPWTFRSISPLQDLVEWRGTTSNPYTGSVNIGRLRTRGGNIAMSFRFNVVDFGGERGPANRTYEELNIYIGNHSTEIRRF